MNQIAGFPTESGVRGVDSGLDALQSSQEFRGPVETLDGHRCNGHFAHVYESREEQFEAAIPFVRDGLKRGERVMYVVEENSEATVRAELEDGGIDVDAAVDSGALSFHTAQETYLRHGSFDVDEMIDFYGDMVSESTREYEALRIVAEMTWLNDADTSIEEFMEYEQKVNDLFDKTDSMAICQYDRQSFSPEIIRNVVQTHPHLIYDGAVCHNVYYTPPEEFFGEDAPARENDRMLRTLRERTAAKSKLQRREQSLRKSYEITSDPARSFDEKLQALFELGCEQFGLELGAMATVDCDADRFEVEYVSDDHRHFEPGLELPLSETYCVAAVDEGGIGSIEDPVEAGYDDAHVHEEFGVKAYLGTYIEVKGDDDRTFFFVSEEPRRSSFSDGELTFQRLLGQWVKYELERQQHEAELRQAKTRFETVFEQSDDGIVVFDPETDDIVDVNPAMCAMTGYSREEFQTLGASDLHPDELDQFDAFLDEIRENGSAWNDELHCRHQRGHDIPAETAGSAITLDGRSLVLANVRHIEERKTHERYQRELHEIIADPQASFEEKIGDLLDVGRERFGLEIGYFDRIDGDSVEIVDTVGPQELLEPGAVDPIDESYCGKVLESSGTLAVPDAAGAGWTDDSVYETFGFDAYLGTTVHVGGDEFGTLCFASRRPRDKPFTDGEQTFLELMGQCVSYELERRRRERFLRDCYEITSDPALDFEAKLERLLDLGREQMGLDAAGLTHLPEWDGKFRNEVTVGYGSDQEDGELWTDPGEGCFCRKVITEGEPVGMADVRGTAWEADSIHQEHGLSSYLGTKVTSGSTPYGTLWVGSSEPRDREFSETERTFIELMGQWVSYEIERREHNQSQRELYEIAADPDLDTDEKIERLLDTGRERLNLPVGMLTRERESAFEIVHMIGSHPDLDEGTVTPPLTDNYCRRVVDTGKSISVGDAGAAGWDGDALYDEFDIECYAGTQVTVRDESHGTVCFANTTAREEFTEAEQSFLDLLGQCVGYEIERQQREADLEETINQLEQSNDRLKQFAYAASHDLQEPLRMVSSYLQLLENRYKDELDQDAREFIDFAVDGADRMRAMVDDLLAYSKVEQADSEFEPVDCDAVIERVTDDLQIQIEENDAEIAVDSLPTLPGDREQLEQLFDNLVSNAIKYNESERPRVEVTADRRGDHWEFEVSDNGIGIDPDQADQIFEVFNRLHNDDDYAGTGVGLSLCQEIVDNHEGDIWVDSETDEGSTFTFTLPAASE